MPIYNAEYTIKYNTVVDPATNRETSILGLRLPLTNEHFYRARVKVRNEFLISTRSSKIFCITLKQSSGLKIYASKTIYVLTRS